MSRPKLKTPWRSKPVPELRFARLPSAWANALMISEDLVARYATPRDFFNAPVFTPASATDETMPPWFMYRNEDERMLVYAIAGIGVVEIEELPDDTTFVTCIGSSGPGVEMRKAWLEDLVTRLFPNVENIGTVGATPLGARS